MKKALLSLYFLLITALASAQDSTKPVEPEMETSYENYELLIIALVGLVILLLIYFYFRRTRRKN